MNKDTENIYSSNDYKQDLEVKHLEGVNTDVKSIKHNAEKKEYERENLFNSNKRLLAKKERENLIDFYKVVKYTINKKRIREVVILRITSELSYDKIALQLKCNERTIRKAYKDGIKLIREELRPIYADKLIHTEMVDTSIVTNGSIDYRCYDSYSEYQPVKNNDVIIEDYKISKNKPYKSSLHSKKQDFYYDPYKIKAKFEPHFKHIKNIIEPMLTSKQTIDIKKRKTISIY